MFARLSREPLVHFLLIGLLLFVLYAMLGGGSGGDRTIRVDDRTLAGLTTQFQRTWQRQPTAAETKALVESYVREEIFYREGLALGLDRDDPTIRRRVRQKFELMAEETSAGDPPTDAQLQAWLDANPGRYAEPALITFEQVMVDAPAHGGSADAALQSARRALAAGTAPAEIGIGRMLPARLDLFPSDLVVRDFGTGFADALIQARTGDWMGPVRSGYGIHLVKVEKIIPGRLPSLNEVRRDVTRDWEADRRAKAADAHYRRLRSEYRIELPDD